MAGCGANFTDLTGLSIAALAGARYVTPVLRTCLGTS
ncbi:MAG: hypothetical protein JWQ97_3432 [Phenylobacterium sp.]|nr:hypothetical protein [Phenylobacterium sp.]